MASSSSGGNSTGRVAAADPEQAAFKAAKQLSLCWNKGPCFKLLQRLILAARDSKAAEAERQTVPLLAAINTGVAAQTSAASTEQVFQGLESQQISKLVSRLLVWLQQLPDETVKHTAGGGSSSHAITLRTACMDCLRNTACYLGTYLNGQPTDALPHVEHLAMSLDSAGGETKLSSSAVSAQAFVLCTA